MPLLSNHGRIEVNKNWRFELDISGWYSFYDKGFPTKYSRSQVLNLIRTTDTPMLLMRGSIDFSSLYAKVVRFMVLWGLRISGGRYSCVDACECYPLQSLWELVMYRKRLSMFQSAQIRYKYRTRIGLVLLSKKNIIQYI